MDTITEQHRLALRLQYLQYQHEQLDLEIAATFEALQAVHDDVETRPTPDTIRPFGGMLDIVWPRRKQAKHVNLDAPRPDGNSD